MPLFSHFARRLIQISERRSPDFIVGTPQNPYLRRWWLIPRNRFFNVYLHQFLRSDDDRALHDHPWISLSLLLQGAYLEVFPGNRWKIRTAGDIVLRGARSTHRIALGKSDKTAPACDPAWTLFITGPRTRGWGFHCPQGFVPWQAFTAPGAEGEIGKGCNQ